METIIKVDINRLEPHPEDPFKLYTEEKLKELAASIAEIGLIHPICVRPYEDGRYQILAGKNRAAAFALLGLTYIDAVILDVDDDTAIMVITDSNLKHREKLLPSEKAHAYKLRLEAVKNRKKPGKSIKNGTSAQVGHQGKAEYIVANENKVSRQNVRRHIRLTYLIKELLDEADKDNLPLTTGVSLSYLDEAAQQAVYRCCYATSDDGVSMADAAYLKRALNENLAPVTDDLIRSLLAEHKILTSGKPFTIDRVKLSPYVGKLPDDKRLMRMFLEWMEEIGVI